MVDVVLVEAFPFVELKREDFFAVQVFPDVVKELHCILFLSVEDDIDSTPCHQFRDDPHYESVMASLGFDLPDLLL